MAAVSFEIQGLKELEKKLDDLEKKIRDKILRKGCRAGAKIIQKESKDRAPIGKTRALKRGIKVRAGKKSRKPRVNVFVTLSAKSMGLNGEQQDSFYAGFQEYGTKNKDGSQRIEPAGFMRQALDVGGERAAKVAIDTYWAEIQKAAA